VVVLHIKHLPTGSQPLLLVKLVYSFKPKAYWGAPNAKQCHVVILFYYFNCQSPAGSAPLPLVKLVDNFDASWDYVANDGQQLTLKTNLDAPRYRWVLNRCYDQQMTDGDM
jgi:hypothetical protein